MVKVRVRTCRDAASDHRCDARAYAHVFHRRGVICVAPSLLRLPLNYSLAIILHELGHLKLGVNRGTECAADRAGARLARVSIQRRTYGKQHRLEFLPSRDLARARAAVLRLTDLTVP